MAMTNQWYEKILERCPCGKKLVPENRTIDISTKVPSQDDITTDIPAHHQYPDNEIVSSRYTILTFLPKNLFEQFHRIANFYFLCVAVISVIISGPVSPWTSILPLMFVVTVTAIKQGYEDWLRHKADKEVNYRTTYVVRDGQEQEVYSKNIRVGDIVKIKANEEIPCDMVMLSSDNEEGECSITTANLDGETNLKTFVCLPDTRSYQTPQSFNDLNVCIECQQPVTDLYSFIGRMHVYDTNGSDITKPLTAENLLLRGCRLKNTSYIYGATVYTGQDTKISLNSRYKAVKFSRVEKRMNAFLIVFMVVLIVYSGIWTGLRYWWYSLDENSREALWYITDDENDPEFKSADFKGVVENFLEFMVLCNYIIPISMYVTVELMKFGGKILFEWDVEMYDPLTNEPARANTSDINEELGQVQFLFTDKTGTLTENEMQFRQCSINGIKYEEIDGNLCFKSDVPGVGSTPLPMMTPDIEALFTVLALCHTVRVDKGEDMLQSNGKVKKRSQQSLLEGQQYEYHASSPDEKALVEACARYGVVYHGVKNDKMAVTYNDKLRKFTQHQVLDFDPTRKRMSCIVETDDNQFYLLVKGADTAILNRCIEGDVQAVEEHITEYAVLGLRTLCIAHKPLSKEEFHQYNEEIRLAGSSLENREEKLAEVYDKIESDFKLLGATAVEDKLQTGVPETIVALRLAGIQVWVLTGDKEETAVNISHSAGHFSSDMTEIYLTKLTTIYEVEQRLQNLLDILSSKTAASYALVIDGQSLVFAVQEFSDMLRNVCMKVDTVLCCRMSPLQKAQVVRLIKTSPQRPTTAAIGDGANDVSMIQEAHVGLGIMGKEGRQAVRCSDYAFGRFKFLERCLLVHGHYFYWRITTLVQYSFYKNVAMITAQLYFTFFSSFSIVTIYDSFFLTFYNTTFTQLPILLHGILGQICPQLVLHNNPRLYQNIRNNASMTYLQFIKWNVIGLWHSLVFFFGCYFAFRDNAPASDGQMYGMYEFGAIIMTVCVITVNIKLMLETYLWNGIIVFGFALTFVGYPSLLFLYNNVLYKLFGSNASLVGVFEKIWSCGYVWLLMLVLVILALLPDIIMRCYNDTFDPMFTSQKIKTKDEEQFGDEDMDMMHTNIVSSSVVHRENVQQASVPNTVNGNIHLSKPAPNKVSGEMGLSNPAFTADGDIVTSYQVGMYVKGNVEILPSNDNYSTYL